MKSRSNSPSARRRRAEEFGAQADLCRLTVCCACWAVQVIRDHVPSWKGAKWDPERMRGYDWSMLPENDGVELVDPHHEPPRGTMRASDDDDTIPLCRRHHTGGWHVVDYVYRHRKRWGISDREARDNFYGFLGIDWQAVRDEMRRRVSENEQAKQLR